METSFKGKKKDLVAGACEFSRLDSPELLMLLDHVAEELAKEYIRLMEVWADREVGE